MPILFDSKEVKKLFKAKYRSETYISELFFTPKYVYKIKKPINLGFTDFTNSKERFRLTKAEYNINKKFSPKIYLKLVPIRKHKEKLSIGRQGRILEYAIKMKRLPQKGWLTLLLEQKKVTDGIAIKVADMIAVAHSKFLPKKENIKYGTPGTIKKNWEEILSHLKNDSLGISINNSELQKLTRISRLYLRKLIPNFRKRISKKKIQRIHGDLHSENIFIENKVPYLIDTVLSIKDWEFGDMGIDISGIAMDFDAYKQKRLSNLLVERYAVKQKDESLNDVLLFYKIYWAAIRLWVNLVGIKQNIKGAQEKAKRYKKILFQYLIEAGL